MLHNLVSPSKEEKNNVVRTILPPFTLVATAPHVPVSHDGVVGTERNLRKPAVLPSNIHLENHSCKTVKKCCRDNQFRGRPRMNPSALAPARNPQDLVHSPWSVPIPVEKRLLNRAAVVTVTPLGSRITVFPRGSGPRTLCTCVYLVCMKLHPWRAASFGLPVVCRSSCLDPRTVTGETFCLVLRPAHPASCIVPHDVLSGRLPLSRPRPIESPIT